MGGPGGAPRDHRSGYQGGKPGQQGMRPNNRGQYGNNNGMAGNNRGPPGMHQQMSGQQNAGPVMNPMAAQNPMAQQQIMQQQQMQQQQVQQQQMAQMTIEQRYLMACHQIISAVVPENPNYKDQVGTVLYEYITQIVGPKAPKVTGMLIDLPIEDIKLIMQDWSLLNTRVVQASELLDQQAMPQ